MSGGLGFMSVSVWFSDRTFDGSDSLASTVVLLASITSPSGNTFLSGVCRFSRQNTVMAIAASTITPPTTAPIIIGSGFGPVFGDVVVVDFVVVEAVVVVTVSETVLVIVVSVVTDVTVAAVGGVK